MGTREAWPQNPEVRVVCVPDDVDLNSVASIPGMGIPDQLKAAMEQEQSSRSTLQGSGLQVQVPVGSEKTSVFIDS